MGGRSLATLKSPLRGFGGTYVKKIYILDTIIVIVVVLPFVKRSNDDVN